jgi:exopolysaccharide biosynthesis polyprenyl glycosylphosphotransferase
VDVFLRRQATLLRRSWIAVEALIVAGTFVAAYFVRANLRVGPNPDLYSLPQYLPLLVAIVPLWAFLLYEQRLYYTQRLSTVAQQWWSLIKAHAYGGIGLAVIIGAGRLDWVSRSFLLIFVLISLVTLGLERTAVLAVLHEVRRRGRNSRNAIIIGTKGRAPEIAAAAAEHPEWGLRVLGFLRAGNGSGPESDEGPEIEAEAAQQRSGAAEANAEAAQEAAVTVGPIFGTADDLPALLKREVIDEVIVCVSPAELSSLDGIVTETELHGVNTRLVADFVDLRIARTEVGFLNGLPVLTFTTLPHRSNELLVKRIMDLTVAGTLGVLSSPILLVIAAAIKLTSNGPVLFRQERVGVNGRPFTMYKFRTMYLGSDKTREGLKERNVMSGPVFKVRKDPRVTPVGRFLRRWTLDEWPQLWNVVRGEMSLVGPRPPLAHEVDGYETWQRRRLSMRPGMTGLWQVSGRNEVDFDEWMRLDLKYIDHWSLLEDLRILAKTLPAVVLGRGAY